MTPEVRERIEQIKNGEVPEGYKSSINGIIPDKWEIKKLSNLLSFKNGINADKEKFGKGTKLISVRDILSDKPIMYDSITGLIDVTQAQLDEFSVTYGDILFQRSSENYEDAGTSNVYLDTNRAVFSGFVIRGKKISEYDPIYLNAVLKTAGSRKNIIRLSAGAQHINIGQESLSKVQIPMAPLTEQQKIAEILTTQDKVIELKQKLIAEKQEQKKYLMQQLLTGKTKLPELSDSWKVVKLSAVLKECKGKNKNQNLRICSVAVQEGVVDQIEHMGRSYAAADTSNYGIAHYGDVIYTKSPTGNFPYGIIKQSHLHEDVAISPLYGIYHPVTFSMGYLLHTYFASPVNAKNYLLPIVQKGAKNTINITNSVFISNKLYLPMDENEQKALADIFITLDKEIELLQLNLEQEKRKKKALMQLLLTGIVRVQP